MPSDMATLEHIIPESLGGHHGESNMALACFRCNNFRGIYPTLDQALLVYIESGKARLFDLLNALPFHFQDCAIRKARRKLREHLTLLAIICPQPSVSCSPH